jgi:imidazolonepropionase-like amidohydrolase
MRVTTCVLVAIALSLWPACKPRTSKPVAKPTAPELDVDEGWVDPMTALPLRSQGDAKMRQAALSNPRAPVIAIRGATILTAAGKNIQSGTIVLSDGAITAIGPDASVSIPAGARIVDGANKFVTPGVIDAHSHIGVYSAPASRAHDDGNESSAPTTPQARAEYAYWPQDPQIARASAGGVTTALILPGSANLIGGEGFTVAMRPGRIQSEVAFPGAPHTLKMACGENPKRVYGDKSGPKTRMGEYAMFRAAFYKARAYAAKQSAYDRARALWIKKRDRAAELDAKRKPGQPKVKVEAAPEEPAVELENETLARVLSGATLVQVHCYKASDMSQMIAIADELGFSIRSFHHALEAYKVRDVLAAKNIAINTWADWWGFKLEAFDGIPENAALVTEIGGRATIHSDSAIGIQRLNQEAAKALASGRAAGIQISDEQALRWITVNPAWVLGIDDVTGTLEVGKRADVALWSGHPFSVYTRAELTISGGDVIFDRTKGLSPSDFELGHTTIDAGRTP